MSISSALSIAASGLRANSIQSDLVARNIANAQAEGYTRKSADLTTRSGSVAVSGISREVDNLLDRLDRTNRSEVARSRTLAEGLGSYTDMLGQPDDEISPAAGLNRVYTALITLSGAPNTPAAQIGVVEGARVLVRQLNELSTTATELSREVELNIRYDVSDVNDRLTRIGQINMRLLQAGSGGTEGAELQDELGRLLDEVSDYMDIQVTNYADGAVNVYTTGGTELVQGRRVNTLTFDSVRGTLFAGDTEITPRAAGVRGFSSGSLAGLFELRNQSVPTIQRELDDFAANLVNRFAAADPTLAAGAQGLFVSGGGVGVGVPGLAGRLAVNARVDPDQGGDASKLITGLGNASTLGAGSTEIVANLLNGFDSRNDTGRTLSEQVANLVAGQQQMRVSAERAVQSAEISGATISASRQNLQGVNIDDELQVLMVIEQSFAANAKVLGTVQTMLDTLLDAV